MLSGISFANRFGVRAPNARADVVDIRNFGIMTGEVDGANRTNKTGHELNQQPGMRGPPLAAWCTHPKVSPMQAALPVS